MITGSPFIFSTNQGGGITSLADLFDGDDGFAYEFDNLSTLWQDTGATTPVTTSGQSIARVDDVSGNGYNATQATAGLRPTYTESGSVAWSDFAADYLTIASSTASLAWLHKDVGFGIAALIRFGTIANPNTVYSLIGNNGLSFGQHGVSVFFDDRGSIPRDEVLVFQMARNVTGFPTYEYVSPDNTITAAVDHTVYVNGPSLGPLDVLLDGVDIADVTRQNPPSASNATYNFQIGAGGNNLFPLTGRIYQLIVRDKEFTADELAAIQTYFESKL